MKKTYRTALGRYIDMDQLRLANEETIAVGNMKVNARGDELGPGGEVRRNRNQVMEEYYKIDPDNRIHKSGNRADEAEVYRNLKKADEHHKDMATLRGSIAKKFLSDQDGEQ
jgi:hypothetical protein